MRSRFTEDVNGIIIGEVSPPTVRLIIINTATGKEAMRKDGFTDDRAAADYARKWLQERRAEYAGYGVGDPYPQGIDCQFQTC